VLTRTCLQAHDYGKGLWLVILSKLSKLMYFKVT